MYRTTQSDTSILTTSSQVWIWRWTCSRTDCGTLRSNRKGFPTELKKHLRKELEIRGDSKVVQPVQVGNLTVSLWQDNRPVVVIARNSDPTTTTTLQRKKKDRSRAEYSCPKSIADYNDCMGGVDANDQLRGYYKVP